MQQLKNILNQLQSYGVTPSEKLYHKIRSAISASPKQQVAPEEELNLQELKHLEIAPPSFLFDAIVAKTKIVEQPAAKVVPIRKFSMLKIAASFIGIAVIAATIWKITQNGLATSESTNTNSLSSNSAQMATSDTLKEAGVKEIVLSSNQLTKNQSSSKKVRRNTVWVDVEGVKYATDDNDLYALFTNFNYKNLPFFLTEESESSVNIKIDKSSSIVLSEGMILMLKKSYQYKKNGKPTHKAKKEKRKLQRWKSNDVKYFNKSLDRSPMDPISLAEFVF